MKKRRFSSIYGLLTGVLFFISILLSLSPDVSASTRQSSTLKRAPLSSTLHDYAGVAKVKLSEMGEMLGFEYPAGYEHIYTGSLLEGYSISYSVGGASHHYYTNFDSTSGGISAVSYTVLEDSASTLIVEAITKTDDSVLEIKNRFVMNKSESKISIIMTVKNTSDAVVSDIRLKRVCDLDLDTDGDYGWAAYDDWFSLSASGIKVWTKDPPVGREAHSMELYGVPQPTWFSVDNWNDWGQKDNTEESFTYPVFGDYTGTLSWDMNSLNAGQTSIPYTAVYSMGIEASNKPVAQTANSAGATTSVFNDSQDIYIKGSMFPASRAVNVYIVADKGWGNGDAIGTDLTGGFQTITTDTSGLLPLTKIWENPLIVGNYDVVADVDGDGLFDYESDAVVGEGVVGFSVIRECVPTISVPHSFVAGTPAKAEEVNENFQLLYQTINSMICEMESLKAKIDAMK